MKTDVSVAIVLTSHREGLLASATLKSLERAIHVAKEAGFSIEILISLDRPDQLTRDVFCSWKEQNVRMFEHDFGDPALCRNRCISEAQSNYIAILDADDLIGRNWLCQALLCAQADRRRIVWHPEVNVVFGEENHIFRHVDMEDENFEMLWMVASNPWTSLCFAHIEAFRTVPYPISDFENGIGHEDWAWNRRVVEVGYLHKIVKGTGHAVRRKAISVVKRAQAAKTIPAPTALFRQHLNNRMAIETARKSLGAPTGSGSIRSLVENRAM